MESKVSAYGLMDFIEKAATKARADIEHSYIDNIKAYFDKDNRPRFISIRDGDKETVIPEICLAGLRPVNIKSVNINMECGIEGVENNELILDLSKEGDKNRISISIAFNTDDIPEGVMRINDKLISEYDV